MSLCIFAGILGKAAWSYSTAPKLALKLGWTLHWSEHQPLEDHRPFITPDPSSALNSQLQHFYLIRFLKWRARPSDAIIQKLMLNNSNLLPSACSQLPVAGMGVSFSFSDSNSHDRKFNSSKQCWSLRCIIIYSLPYAEFHGLLYDVCFRNQI